jgi:alpha-mannosidase
VGFLLEASYDLDGLAQLESELDRGDTYTFQPVEHDRPVRGWWSQPRSVWQGPLVAAIQRDVSVGERARATISARVDAGSSLVRFAVDGTNLAGNHRLRIRFPIPQSVSQSVADMQYGPVTRQRRSYDRRDFPREWPVTTAPMHRYVSVGDGARGLTVFTRDAFEYELTGDDGIAITLLRAVGDFSREDLTARPGNAGWPLSTPEAQEPGGFRHELALLPIGVGENSTAADWETVERAAEEFHAPLAGLMLRYGIDVPREVAGPELHGPGLVFKALKPSESGEGVVLRCVNLTSKLVQGAWRWPVPVGRARLARLDETPGAEISLAAGGREIRFTAQPREVVTILVDKAGEEGRGKREE